MKVLSELVAKWRKTGDGEIGNAYSGPYYDCAKELEAALAARQPVDQPNEPGRTLFLDLDGVMADFDLHFHQCFGQHCRELDDEIMWPLIYGHHTPFFRSMPPMPGALEFFKQIEHLNPVILTACPKTNYAAVATQKREWVREHLSKTCMVLPVMGSHNKPLFMHQPGDVLIDDYGKNCRAWAAAGGNAIKHEGDWHNTLEDTVNAMRK